MTLADPDLAFYRRGVGIMLIDRAGRVFVGRRIDMPAGMEAWQMPQGGIDPGETPRQAALRELHEEVGTDRVEILAESCRWLRYDLPAAMVPRPWGGRWRGQCQKWFAMRFVGADSDIDPAGTDHPEFDAWEWVPPARLTQLIVPFKRLLYDEVLAELGGYCRPA